METLLTPETLTEDLYDAGPLVFHREEDRAQEYGAASGELPEFLRKLEEEKTAEEKAAQKVAEKEAREAEGGKGESETAATPKERAKPAGKPLVEGAKPKPESVAVPKGGEGVVTAVQGTPPSDVPALAAPPEGPAVLVQPKPPTSPADLHSQVLATVTQPAMKATVGTTLAAAQGGSGMRQAGTKVTAYLDLLDDQIPGNAEKVKPPLPEKVEMPAPTPENPLPKAEWDIEQASGKALPDYTPPAFEASPDPMKNMPAEDNQGLSDPHQFTRFMSGPMMGPPTKEQEEEGKFFEALRKQMAKRPKIDAKKGKDEKKAKVAMLSAPAPPKVPLLKAAKPADAARVFARLMATSENISKDMVKNARTRFAPVLDTCMPNLGDDTIAPKLKKKLDTELRDIAIEAGATEEALVEEVAKETERLRAETEKGLQDNQKAHAEANTQVAEASKRSKQRVDDAKKEVAEWSEDLEYHPHYWGQQGKIRHKGDVLTTRARRKAADAYAQYKFAYEGLKKALGTARQKQLGAYDYVAQQDEYQLTNNLVPGVSKDQAPAKIQESKDWAKKKKEDVVKAFDGFAEDAQTKYQERQKELDTAAKDAVMMIRDWVRERTWDEPFAAVAEGFHDYGSQAVENADAWARLEQTSMAADTTKTMEFLARVREAADKGVTEQAMLADERLTREQQGIVRAFFNAPKDKPFDPVEFLARSAQQRIAQLHSSELSSSIDREIMETADAHQLEQVGNDLGPRKDVKVSERSSAMFQALHGHVFNEGQTAVEQLRGLNKYHWKAFEMTYGAQLKAHNKELSEQGALLGYVKETLDEDLKDELYEGQRVQVRALKELSYDPTDMDAVNTEIAGALYAAMHDVSAGTGIGSEHQVVLERLRNLDTGQSKEIEEIYRKKFKRNLREDLKGELASTWLVFSSRDHERALLQLDEKQDEADAVWFDQVLHTERSFWSGPVGEVADIHAQIKKDVDIEADKASQKNPREEWNSKKRANRVAEKLAGIEKVYNRDLAGKPIPDTDYYDADGNYYPPVTRKPLEEAMRIGVTKAEGDQMVAYLRNDRAGIGASKIQVERKAAINSSDDAINAALGSQYDQAFEDVKIDEGPGLKKKLDENLKTQIEQAAKDGHPMTGAQIWELRQKLEIQMDKDLVAFARERAQKYMKEMTDRHLSDYGETVETVIKENVGDDIFALDQDQAWDRLLQGGYLSPYQEVRGASFGLGFSGKGARFKHALQGRTATEISEMDGLWQAEFGESLETGLRGEVSGQDWMDIRVLLKGRPETIDQAVAIEEFRAAISTEGVPPGLASFEAANIQYRLNELRRLAALLKDPKSAELDPTVLNSLVGAFSFAQEAAKESVAQHRAVVNAVTDTIATVAAIAVAVVIGIGGALFTGGASAAIAIALIASIVATATSMGIRYAMLGNGYGYREIATDVAIGVIDAIMAVLTAGIGNALMRTSTVAAKEAAKEIERLAARGLLARILLANEGIIAKNIKPIGLLTRMADEEAHFLSRFAAKAMAQTVENVVQSIPSAVVGAAAQEQTWDHGNPFFNLVHNAGMQVAQGAAMGGMFHVGFEIGGALKGPHIGADTTLRMPERLEGPDFQKHFNEYKRLYPNHSEADFRVLTDQSYDRAMKQFETQRDLRASVRAEVDSALPEGLRGQYGDVPITPLSPFEFFKAGGFGDAAVIVRDGQVHIIVKEGGDPGAIREHVGKIVREAEPGTFGRTKDPRAALPPDLRGRVPMIENPELGARGVKVVPGEDGIHIEHGPLATAEDIRQHVRTARTQLRLQGVLRGAYELIDRFRFWNTEHSVPPKGSTAAEARYELDKLPDIIKRRQFELTHPDLTPTQRLRMEAEIIDLHEQLAAHQRAFLEFDKSPGRGFIAAGGVPDLPPGTKGPNYGIEVADNPDAHVMRPLDDGSAFSETYKGRAYQVGEEWVIWREGQWRRIRRVAAVEVSADGKVIRTDTREEILVHPKDADEPHWTNYRGNKAQGDAAEVAARWMALAGFGADKQGFILASQNDSGQGIDLVIVEYDPKMVGVEGYQPFLRIVEVKDVKSLGFVDITAINPNLVQNIEEHIWRPIWEGERLKLWKPVAGELVMLPGTDVEARLLFSALAGGDTSRQSFELWETRARTKAEGGDKRLIINKLAEAVPLRVVAADVEKELKAGKSRNDVLKAGFKPDELLAAGFKRDELLKAGYKAEDVAAAQLELENLPEFTYRRLEIDPDLLVEARRAAATKERLDQSIPQLETARALGLDIRNPEHVKQAHAIEHAIDTAGGAVAPREERSYRIEAPAAEVSTAGLHDLANRVLDHLASTPLNSRTGTLNEPWSAIRISSLRPEQRVQLALLLQRRARLRYMEHGLGRIVLFTDSPLAASRLFPIDQALGAKMISQEVYERYALYFK